ncbi:AMP-binding protein, partial [Frateuria sp. Soil773]|uniref:AMP-binding protein n=1 Tax=Frateuria sp. Soil773 TaxID=1736407 RepID=UPI001F395AC9
MAAAQPTRPALIDGASSFTLDYATLANRALQVASLLQAHGVQPGDPVALSLPRGSDAVVAVLGILAAGACYVPIALAQPAARRQRIQRTAGIRHVLTDAEHAPQVSDAIAIDIETAIEHAPLPAPITVDPAASAYVIFTSGSTGEPKGVEVSHRAAANTLDDLNTRYRVGPQDRGLAVSALDFDLSVYDLCGLLGAGASLVLLDEVDRRDASAWLRYVHDHRVTVWNSVPVLLDMLLVVAEGDGRPLPLRLAMASGDWIGLDLPAR